MVSEGTTPRVAKPKRWMVALVAFSVLVCAPPALCQSDKKPLAKKNQTVFASPVNLLQGQTVSSASQRQFQRDGDTTNQQQLAGS